MVNQTRRIRVGHHSTSDDSFAYRPRSEVEDRKRIDNPIVRFRLFLEARGWWNAEAEAELKERLRADVMKSFKRAESLKRHELGELFSDVYAGEQPWNLVSIWFRNLCFISAHSTYVNYVTLVAIARAKGRTRQTAQEIWERLGAVEERALQIQG